MTVRYQCPGCGRSIASTGPIYSTPEKTYVYLRSHYGSLSNVEFCSTVSVTVATKPASASAPATRGSAAPGAGAHGATGPAPPAELRPVAPLSDSLGRSLLSDSSGSLGGSCSYCQRPVDNHDEHHRVTSIMRGGRGVECVLRGDIQPQEARPMGPRP